ncbi:monovalent cation/H(+) antiporter subunit G [Herbivorax sp. ANBcel31]|uniref:monovalent cation/H(+) antiporter subunit G n=1 Tax=Herbivorax sp. ANBcel31 TaxID=3069754 RepID=UPI0027B46885|nr:monovalent cation/H(+) antiporter subunit G [Herbivorax sp. ANBcel31]MDQ2086168.1 monovalent cation/H(+) antiporter subunit G [Herbivorax sp. ANBcel31]
MSMLNLLGNILIVFGIILSAFGVYGIFRFNDFYSRVLISSKVDTVGFMTIMLGVILKNGFNFFSFKVLLIVIIAVITTPLATHAIARSAYISGYKIKKEDD